MEFVFALLMNYGVIAVFAVFALYNTINTWLSISNGGNETYGVSIFFAVLIAISIAANQSLTLSQLAVYIGTYLIAGLIYSTSTVLYSFKNSIGNVRQKIEELSKTVQYCHSRYFTMSLVERKFKIFTATILSDVFSKMLFWPLFLILNMIGDVIVELVKKVVSSIANYMNNKIHALYDSLGIPPKV